MEDVAPYEGKLPNKTYLEELRLLQIELLELQRHVVETGEIVFYDRSWYNRAGVEKVMESCTPKEYGELFRQVPGFERSLVESAISLPKLWFTVSRHNQKKRFEGRLEDPLRRWKFSPMDEESQKRWHGCSEARDAMGSSAVDAVSATGAGAEVSRPDAPPPRRC